VRRDENAKSCEKRVRAQGEGCAFYRRRGTGRRHITPHLPVSKLTAEMVVEMKVAKRTRKGGNESHEMLKFGSDRREYST